MWLHYARLENTFLICKNKSSYFDILSKKYKHKKRPLKEQRPLLDNCSVPGRLRVDEVLQLAVHICHIFCGHWEIDISCRFPPLLLQKLDLLADVLVLTALSILGCQFRQPYELYLAALTFCHASCASVAGRFPRLVFSILFSVC